MWYLLKNRIEKFVGFQRANHLTDALLANWHHFVHHRLSQFGNPVTPCRFNHHTKNRRILKVTGLGQYGNAFQCVKEILLNNDSQTRLATVIPSAACDSHDITPLQASHPVTSETDSTQSTTARSRVACAATLCACLRHSSANSGRLVSGAQI